MKRERPRVSAADPGFKQAVADGLKTYRDRGNPEGRQLTDTQLAGRLGVSPATLSKYLNCKQIIGGEHLVRAMIKLGVAVNYQGKELGIRESSVVAKPACPEQICFVFDAPSLLDETVDHFDVRLDRRLPAVVTVELRRAG
jgi:transcriptional regulator with XRE-family HTH domain